MYGAKGRAKKLGLEFNLTIEDIIIPEFCPVLGIKLKQSFGNLSDASPSLDRIVPELGYVKGNVKVISNRANTIKNNATLSELEKIAEYVRVNLIK